MKSPKRRPYAVIAVSAAVAALSLAAVTGTAEPSKAGVPTTTQPVDRAGNPVPKPVAQPVWPKPKQLSSQKLRQGERLSPGNTLAEAKELAALAQGKDAHHRGKPKLGSKEVGQPIMMHDHAAMGMDQGGADQEGDAEPAGGGQVATSADSTKASSDAVQATAVTQGPTNLPTNVGGRWSMGPTLPTASVHTVLLNTGKVLIIAGSGNVSNRFSAGTFTTTLWNPADNSFKAISTPYDMFCAGHVMLADGRVLVAGGTLSYPTYVQNAAGDWVLKDDWKGSKEVYVFDPIKEIYEQAESMHVGRWYPTLVRMGNGDVITVAGLDEGTATRGGLDTPVNEVFKPNPDSTWDNWAGGSWKPLGERAFPWYAQLILTGKGELFYTGGSSANNGQPAGLWNPYTNRWREVPGLKYEWQRNAAGSVLLPPAQQQKVMVIGGGDGSLPTLNDTQLVDLTKKNPSFTAGPPIAHPKMYVGAVTLPDYTVLQTNGAAKFRQIGVHDAQIYNPATNAWVSMNSPTIDRLYHSSAILLPDGRVATMGSQALESDTVKGDATNELRMEIFEPPYLFKGQRPTITDGPTQITYGAVNHPTWKVTVAAGATIKKVSLLRPSATTHSTDTEQRLVDLPFTVSNGEVRTTITGNKNLLPPGWYMLTVLDSLGRPSVAKWVSVN